MPYLSVIVPTMRAGGVDILFDSLAAQTFTDFELVLVDALYEHRHGRLAEEARDRFLCTRLVGLSPSPFPVCAFCSYANAGIMASTGEVLVFMVDFTRLPPDLLAKHASFHKEDKTGRRGLMGPHRYIGLDVARGFPRYGAAEIERYAQNIEAGHLEEFMWSIGKPIDQPSAPHRADGGAVVPPDADPKLRLPPGPIGPEFFHAKNESASREAVLEIGGWDTDLDGAHLYQDSDFADRLTAKAGVTWTLDPSAIVEIANPRHVFPFARRTRPHEANYEIWQRKKRAGYPAPRRRLAETTVQEIANPGARAAPIESGGAAPMRILMIYGEFSSAIHGPFDLDGLYTRQGLTGSESSFFNLARSLGEAGHQVGVLLHCDAPGVIAPNIEALPIKAVRGIGGLQIDALIAWNEPDYLQFAPPGVLRICAQQLNDFGYCQHPRWRELVDWWVSPSESHRENVMVRESGISGSTVEVIPNSVDLALFDPARTIDRVRGRAVYCSSPDRGLHHVLNMWPTIRGLSPHATLKVFYRLEPWIARARDLGDEVGQRARYIEAAIKALSRRSMGIEIVGPVSNQRMADELRAATALVYPCDPVRYTEGFGCSVLDAAAAGCVPFIAPADALGEVHGAAANVLVGTLDPEAWARALAPTLDTGAGEAMVAKMKAHATAHDRRKVGALWEALLVRLRSWRQSAFTSGETQTAALRSASPR